MTGVGALISTLELPEQSDPNWGKCAESAARARLLAAIAEETWDSRSRGSSPRSHSLRGRRPPLVAITLAAGLAAALVVVFALLPSSGGEPELGVGQATAQAVLERAAQIAATTPPSTVPNAHQFLYVKWIDGYTGDTTARGHTFGLTSSQAEQDWEAPNGSGRQRLSHGYYRFLSPADRAAWEAAGRPPVAPTTTDGTYPVGAYFNGCGVTPRGPSGLSTDPTKLLSQVIDRYEHRHYSAGTTLQTAACILVTSAYPPLRAATYRMLEHLPGVGLLGSMRDGIGRRGIALGVPDPKTGLRAVVILDPTTARPLELETIQASVVVSSQILVGSGVVDSEEALPGGGTVPFKRPPVVRVTEPSVPANPRQPQVTTLTALRHELAILRRAQRPQDRLPVSAVRDEQSYSSSWSLNVGKLIPSETRLLASFKVPPNETSGLFHGPERIYLVLGTLPRSWSAKGALNGWHQPAAEDSDLHLSIVGFVHARMLEQPLDVIRAPGQTSVPAQTLTPLDVMVGGEVGIVGIVPDGVTRVRWELIDPGQPHPVTVYPTIHGNVAIAPLTKSYGHYGLINEQELASAVWYGRDGRVVASVNALGALRRAFGW